MTWRRIDVQAWVLFVTVLVVVVLYGLSVVPGGSNVPLGALIFGSMLMWTVVVFVNVRKCIRQLRMLEQDRSNRDAMVEMLRESTVLLVIHGFFPLLVLGTILLLQPL